jgi:hypothetical protein
MRARYYALAFSMLAASGGLAFGQGDQNIKYYYAKTESGADVPRPDPWCSLTEFKGQSLWACPRNGSHPLTEEQVRPRTRSTSTEGRVEGTAMNTDASDGGSMDTAREDSETMSSSESGGDSGSSGGGGGGGGNESTD